MGDRSKYFGILPSLTFAALLITESCTIFVGLMTRTYSVITNLGLPGIWVMDPDVKDINDIKALQDTEL